MRKLSAKHVEDTKCFRQLSASTDRHARKVGIGFERKHMKDQVAYEGDHEQRRKEFEHQTSTLAKTTHTEFMGGRAAADRHEIVKQDTHNRALSGHSRKIREAREAAAAEKLSISKQCRERRATAPGKPHPPRMGHFKNGMAGQHWNHSDGPRVVDGPGTDPVDL